MYTGVNGDNTIEQVYRIELSRNYGWDNKEGSFLWNPVTGDATADPNPDPQFASPLAEYDHNATGAAFGSVIGGFVYRGTAMPEFCGRYFFFDWLAGKVIAMNIHTGALEIVPVDPAGAQPIPTLDITWGEDESGELYIGRASGEILKLVSTFSPARPAGDIDLDGDVDLADAESLAECLGGPDVYTLPPGCPAAHFDLADVTCDNDVDLYDFAVLQQILTNRPSGAK
jgi:hypothetical protein